MRRQYSLWSAAVAATFATFLACAGGQTGGGSADADRQRIVNLVPFDIANCFTTKVDLGKTANEYTLQAAYRAARPSVQECLADGRVQNPSAPTRGKATMSIDSTGTSVAVAGEGLQPAGASCIEKAIRAQLDGVSAPPGGKPVTLEAPFERDPRNMVRLGVNDSSDVVGTIRLALPQWCACFDSIKTQAPPELTGSVTLLRPDYVQYADRLPDPKDGGVKITKAVTSALQSTDPSGAQAAACMNDRVNTLPPFKITPDILTVPVQLLLVNSNAPAGSSASAPPSLQFAQLDAAREQKEAESFAALTRRQTVANAYDAQVQAYQTASNSKDPKKRHAAGAMIKDLKSGCAALVKADDEYAKALEGEAAVEQQALQLAQTLKATDPSWADAEKASGGMLADTQKQIDAAKQLRAANDKACPKEKF